MILYHFTLEQNLSGISKRGLLVTPIRYDFPFTSGSVWLTTETNPGPWAIAKDGCRLTITIPAGDKRLERFSKLFKQHYRSKEIKDFQRRLNRPAAFSSAMKHWWVYYGNIPRSRIVETKSFTS